MANITKDKLKVELEGAKKALEQVKADANVAIGVALGKIQLLEMQIQYLDVPEEIPTPTAELDQLDNHPVKRAQAVAQAAIS